jgi:DNA-binding NarL/FixJ family response regulator
MPIGRAAAIQVPPLAPSGEGVEGGVFIKPKGQRINILLVDDHKIMRQGLSSLLQFENDLEVIAEAENGQRALEMAGQHKPDVIIMDVNMPVMNGIEATKILMKEMPHLKVIGLSMHLDGEAANAMREAGAVAFLTKGGPSEDLIAAIRACRTKRTEPARASKKDDEPAAVEPSGAPEKAGPHAKKIRVLVADDNGTMREMLAARLSHEADIEVVGQAEDGEEGIRLARSKRPNVVVVDASMPGMGGIEATRRLRREIPGVRVIGLSAYGETDEEQAAMRAAGAVNCVMKEPSCQKLIAAIRTCMGR